ncbi:FAD:protein FMN transferase [Granulicella arctica]|uniref:FAD:protein FMN transferase n=1 Tax=Granulicella arctica TaxID=940613 RepID=A0A7Y9PIZ8_9BACT|nr:FAD:protein FMN transferase [Granulicella arctica]NYF80782.1 thiamine biosynthesis lipoprotein [Granulicella arctica]
MQTVVRLGWIVTIAAAIALAIPARCHMAPARKLYTFRHPAMGTQFALYVYARTEAEASGVADEVFEEVDRIEQELSNYRETSELSRIDREAASTPVTTDPETFRFLQASQHWSEGSDGAFDISVGPLMKAWGFFNHSGRVPSEEDLDRIRPMVGYRNIALDPATRTVAFRVPGVELDPGGIGKGFAVDAAVTILRARHISAALISAGSSTVYALGAPPGKRGWRVVVPDGSPDRVPISTVLLRDTSLSSANCSEKNFIASGRLYCHIMDPRTLRPVEGRLHVSIIDPSATTSDALSNVLFVDTPAESLAFLKRYAPEAHALIVSGKADVPRCTVFQWQTPVETKRCPLFQKQELVGQGR